MRGGLTGFALRSLWNRRGSVLLSVLTLAITVALLLMVERVRMETREGFLRSVSGVDLIVGARGHPVQLLLYSVFRLGDATNNLSWESYQALAEHPQVGWTVPISLGDSHRGYRVVGTTTEYFARLGGGDGAAEFSAGGAFAETFEAVIGAEVARRLNYSVGTAIELAHGTGRINLHNHDDRSFRVSGILAPTGTPLDQGIYVSLQAIEAIHLNWRSGTRIGSAPDLDEAQLAALQPRSITAVFVGAQRRAAVFSLQRMVNGYRAEPLTGLLPGVTMQQLWQLTGGAETALRFASYALVGCALMVLLSGLLSTLNERRREMALLRAVGAGARHVFALLLVEALLLVLVALLLGLLLAIVGLVLATPWLHAQFGIQLREIWPGMTEMQVLLGLLLSGALVGLIPAITAYRRTLLDGLTVDR